MTTYLVTTFYSFQPLQKEDLARIRDAARKHAMENKIRGLLVLGFEGMNATIAGLEEAVHTFKEMVRTWNGGVDPHFKDSRASKLPFARFKVDLRPEIVSLKKDLHGELPPDETYLTPAEWDRMVLTDPDVVMVDARNDYEVQIGKFKDAVNPGISKFSELPQYLSTSGIPRTKKILLYCTGGIRCEKAVVEAKRIGYKKVFHLRGGILKYFEESNENLFQGECFVFDHRVAVDRTLHPSQIFKLCPHCGNPAREIITCRNCDTNTVVCKRCLMRDDRYSCSKNCAYHLRRNANR